MQVDAHVKNKNNGAWDGNQDLMVEKIDVEVGKRFDAHGIAKKTATEQLETLLSILDNGIDPKRPFHTAPLAADPTAQGALAVGLGAAEAYRNGSFIILGNIDTPISKGGVKYVLVNDIYYDAIPKLKKAYPSVEFIKANEANARLTEIATTSIT